jgi:hypothetical protein
MDHELLLRNEFLLTENRIIRQQITGHVRLTDGEQYTSALTDRCILSLIFSLC